MSTDEPEKPEDGEPAAPSTIAIPDDPDAPTLPEEADLLEAVGARKPAAGRNRRPENLDKPDKLDEPDDLGDDERDPEQRTSRNRLWMVLAGTLLAGGTIAAFVLLGRSNSERFELVCQPDKIVAEQGRTFPPWGIRPISGPEWKPIDIPPNAECAHLDANDQAALGAAFEDALEKRANVLLKDETASAGGKVDLAEQLLDQALLFLRAPTQATHRGEVERLLGDVGYWRALAKLRDASTALTDAAKQFDAAAAKKPKITNDASAWANYIRKIADELHVGPKGVAASFAPLPPVGADRPPAPTGVALPIEGSGSAPVEAPLPAPPPDAGVQTGGVLM